MPAKRKGRAAAKTKELDPVEAARHAHLQAGLIDETDVETGELGLDPEAEAALEAHVTSMQGSTIAEAHTDAQSEDATPRAQANRDQADTTGPSDVAFDNDMEAAMEEDVAGEATGVSRRNPDYTSAPSMGLYNTAWQTSGTERRSGLDDANWFNRFRESLASDVQPVAYSPTDADAPEQYAGPTDDDETTLYT